MKSLATGILFVLTAFLFHGCTPKTTEPVVRAEDNPVNTQQPPTPKAEEKLSPCPKFSDAPNPDEAETNYVLYRDFLRVKDYPRAYEFWKKVYEVAPAADGRRNTVLADGIFFMEHFMAQTTDSLTREGYIDEIFRLYDRVGECYPEGGYVNGRKAFDLYYKYPHRASRKEIYDLFRASIDMDGMKTQDFVINPFTALLVELYFENQISMEEAQTYQARIRQVLANGLGTCKDKDCERWKIIEGYAPVRLEAFETVKGFYDCDYYLDKYYQDFLDNPKDCDVIRTVYSRLKWGGCEDTNEKLAALIRTGNENCVEESALSKAYQALRDGDYDLAINLFQEAADKEEAREKKAHYLLIIAKIYYAHKKNFPRSRQFALQAADVRPNWGEPFLLIGQLYASSGPLCGPGTGWDSQIVVWPAIDMWNKARRVDPAAAAEANKWIGRYARFMPNREDIFLRNLQAGQSFYVGCWIQESTTIRTSD